MDKKTITIRNTQDTECGNNSSTYKGSSVSLIMPLKNFQPWVKKTYEGVVQVLESNCEDFEIIFVDDASTDGTWDQLSEICRKDDRVKLIRLRSPSGESASFDVGVRFAKGEKIIFDMGRVRIKPAGIGNILNKLDEGHDLVVGWRIRREDSKLNQVISKIFNAIARCISNLHLHDINSGILATQRKLLEEISFYGTLNVFLPIFAARKGYKVAEAKVDQQVGTFRKSKYVSEYIQRILDVITVIFLTSYFKKPLHFLGFFGVIFLLAGLVLNGYLFVYRFFGFGGIAGRPLLVLGAMLLVVGIQMISIGLIGEMIIFTHARELKDYDIEEVIE